MSGNKDVAIREDADVGGTTGNKGAEGKPPSKVAGLAKAAPREERSKE